MSDLPVTLRALYLHPVKSCGGIAVDEALVIETGLEFDRAWMVVDEAGEFLSARELRFSETSTRRLGIRVRRERFSERLDGIRVAAAGELPLGLLDEIPPAGFPFAPLHVAAPELERAAGKTQDQRLFRLLEDFAPDLPSVFQDHDVSEER